MVVLGVDAARTHELQRAVDLVGDLLVLATLGARCHELLRPRMHPGEVGETALGERAHEVQRGRRLVVRLHEPLGVRGACRLGGRGVVHDVPAEAGQLDAADHLVRRRPRLGELAGDAADLHHRHAERVREHDGHLQDDPQLLTDVHRRELLEALGAVAGLQQEGVAGRHLGERRLQRARLAGEDERGIAGDLLQGAVEVAEIGPVGLLLCRVCLPGRRSPAGSRGRCHGWNATDGAPDGGRAFHRRRRLRRRSSAGVGSIAPGSDAEPEQPDALASPSSTVTENWSTTSSFDTRTSIRSLRDRQRVAHRLDAAVVEHHAHRVAVDLERHVPGVATDDHGATDRADGHLAGQLAGTIEPFERHPRPLLGDVHRLAAAVGTGRHADHAVAWHGRAAVDRDQRRCRVAEQHVVDPVPQAGERRVLHVLAPRGQRGVAPRAPHEQQHHTDPAPAVQRRATRRAA